LSYNIGETRRVGWAYEIAKAVARCSTCRPTRQIGAVILGGWKILGVGWNGPKEQCVSCRKVEGGTCLAVHAEVRAILAAGHRARGSEMFLTCEIPCVGCAGVIVESGISTVWTPKAEFYDDAAREIFQGSRVIIRELPSGKVVSV